MPDLVTVMQARFKRLLLDFDMTFSAEQVVHAGERGRLLEETLKSFLRVSLPKRVGVGTGQIMGAMEEQPSRQMDVVLYDYLNFPLLLDEGSYQLFPSEAVLATIEVKSVLNKKHLKASVENIASSKSIRKFPQGDHPSTLGIIFGYRTQWERPKSLFFNLSEECKAIGWANAPDLICSLSPEPYMLVSAATLGESLARFSTRVAGTEHKNEFPPDKHVLVRAMDFSKEHILLWFYLLVVDYLNRSLNIGVNMAQYMKGNTVWITDVIDLAKYA